MKRQLNDKEKELLNIYWVALIVLSAVGLVNLLAISQENLKASAIVNFIFLIIVPIIFILGYIDYRNFKPLTKKKEILYCIIGTVSLWIQLIHFNVQNYTFLSEISHESLYNRGISIVAALYFAIGAVCLILTIINRHNRRRQAKYYFIVAGASLVSNLFLTIFNYGTFVSLFWAPALLLGFENPIIIDTGMTIFALRVFVEGCLFLAHARVEKKKHFVKEGENTEYKKPLCSATAVAISFVLVIEIILPIIGQCAFIFEDYYGPLKICYKIIEIISVVVLLIAGFYVAFSFKSDEKFAPVYMRMGVAIISFAILFLILDFIPITKIIIPKNEVKAQVIVDIYHATVKMLWLLGYTLYVGLNKKLNNTLTRLDKEYEEKMSTENYSI